MKKIILIILILLTSSVFTFASGGREAMVKRAETKILDYDDIIWDLPINEVKKVLKLSPRFTLEKTYIDLLIYSASYDNDNYNYSGDLNLKFVFKNNKLKQIFYSVSFNESNEDITQLINLYNSILKTHENHTLSPNYDPNFMFASYTDVDIFVETRRVFEEGLSFSTIGSLLIVTMTHPDSDYDTMMDYGESIENQ